MKPLLYALLSGFLFAISLPPHNCELVAWVAFVPLLVATGRRRPIDAVVPCIAAGLAAGLAEAGWNMSMGELCLYCAYFPFLELALVLIVLAGAASFVRRRRIRGIIWVAWTAAMGVTCEYLTRFLPLPIYFALTQYRNLPLIQMADVFGIWGVSFLLWWSNAAIADALLSRLEKPPSQQAGGRFQQPNSRQQAMPFVVGACLIAAALFYGAITLRPLPRSGLFLTVAAVQSYHGLDVPGLPRPRRASNRGALTLAAANRGAQAVVWPEGTLGYNFHALSKRDGTLALARNLKVMLVAGYYKSAHPKPYNCAALITEDGQVAGIHRKIALYGEEGQTFQAGTRADSFPTVRGRIGMEICFDTCNSSVTRRIARSGAQLIAVPTYDPPVVNGVMHRLHASLMPFRAVENHVPMVRSDSNGASEIIDAHGRILVEGPIYQPALLVRRIMLGDGHGTFFTRWGDWFAGVCGAYAATILIFIAAVRRKKIGQALSSDSATAHER